MLSNRKAFLLFKFSFGIFATGIPCQMWHALRQTCAHDSDARVSHGEGAKLHYQMIIKVKLKYFTKHQ